MSIVLFILMLLAFVVILWFINQNRRPLFSGRLSKYLIFIYCGILLISTAVVYTLPEKDLIKTPEDHSQLNRQAQELSARLPEYVKNDKLDNIPGIYKKAEKSFEISRDKLEVVPKLDMGFPMEVLVESKDTQDGVVHASSYVTTSIIQGIDITDHLASPMIELRGNRLEIASIQNYTLNYTSFKPDFTAEQFYDFYSSSRLKYSNAIFGREVLYLQVPKNMKVIDGGHIQVTYLN